MCTISDGTIELTTRGVTEGVSGSVGFLPILYKKHFYPLSDLYDVDIQDISSPRFAKNSWEYLIGLFLQIFVCFYRVNTTSNFFGKGYSL